MKIYRMPLAALAVLALSPDAQAQDAATAPAAPAAAEAALPPRDSALLEQGLKPTGPTDGCELHIWPAERMASQTSGLLGAGLLSAAINGKRDSTNQSLMASALDSPSQLNALTSLDLRTLLNRTPGTTIVLHETPLERHTMNKVKTRRSDSTAQCYSELIVADVFYQKAMMYGRSLRTLFMLRDFGNDQKIDKEYKAWGGNGLSLFPPKEGDDAVAALDELVSVFKGNFDEYSRNARRALAAKSKG
jgi:hypothetical protein